MTPKEHQLVIEMFKQQMMFYAGIVELLKSRGLLDKGDLESFDALVSSSSREFFERWVSERYQEIGIALGVPDLPPL